MANFFDEISFDDAERMEQLARLIFEFRVSRDGLLRQYEVADAAGLLESISSGAVAEHPGYDHYLSLKVLDEMREAVRAELKDLRPGVKPA